MAGLFREEFHELGNPRKINIAKAITMIDEVASSLAGPATFPQE